MPNQARPCFGEGQADQTAQFVYVANIYSDNVSAYTIDGSTGALAPVDGSPFPAGSRPASVVTTMTTQSNPERRVVARQKLRPEPLAWEREK
jgi:hypothetical protein